MTLSLSLPRHALGRTAAAWTSAAMALAMLTSCSGAQPDPAAEGTAASSSLAYRAPAETPSSEALAALKEREVATRGTMSDYDRDGLFGGWIDADGDCEDTRQEILNRDLDNVVSADGCTVDSGILNKDLYTDTTINFVRGPTTSSDAQIDHVVSLGNAWITGARNLSQDERVELANDPLNLLAVDGPTNQAKSDKPANEWLPPNVDFRCEFVAIQIAVKAKYGLWVTTPEKTAMAETLVGCQGQEVPTGAIVGDIDANVAATAEGTPAPAPAQGTPASEPNSVAPEPEPAPTETAVPAGGFANCSAAKAAGAAPIYAGSPGYEPKMDRDGDGIACES